MSQLQNHRVMRQMVGRSPRDRRKVWRSAGAGRPPYRVL